MTQPLQQNYRMVNQPINTYQNINSNSYRDQFNPNPNIIGSPSSYQQNNHNQNNPINYVSRPISPNQNPPNLYQSPSNRNQNTIISNSNPFSNNPSTNQQQIPISNPNTNPSQNLQQTLQQVANNNSVFRQRPPNQNSMRRQLNNMIQLPEALRQQLFIQPQINVHDQTVNKMDGLYADSYKKAKIIYIIHFIVILILWLGWLIIYKILPFKNKMNLKDYIRMDGSYKSAIIGWMLVLQAILLFFKISIYFRTIRSLQFAIKTAQFTNHAVSGQPYNKDFDFDQNTSKRKYLESADISQIQFQALDFQTKNAYKQQTYTKITTAIKREQSCTNCLQQLLEFGMFICSIYLIFILAHDHTRWFQKVLLISTIIYYFGINYKTIGILLVLALSPLIAIVIVIVVCCIQRRNNRAQLVKLPAARKPTNQQIINAGGTCAICMMDFSTSDDVVFLPCSNKHMFHNLCISGWLNVKTTCPNCRFELTS